MKVYIYNRSSISHQASFLQKNSWENRTKLTENHALILPNYKDYISPSSLRRLSPLLKMALANALELQQNTKQAFDAICVGTGLGCLNDSEKFLRTWISNPDSIQSPTAFIQSTHNTIAGQIAIELQVNAYNMTHTQHALSFEMALKDVMLLASEGKESILFGAGDEHIASFDLLEDCEENRSYPRTSSASFFVGGKSPQAHAACVIASQIYSTTALDATIVSFLNSHQFEKEDISMLLQSSAIPIQGFKNQINYLDYVGLNDSASAFAFHLAIDFKYELTPSVVLICNQQVKGKIGLTLIQHDAT